MLQATVTNFEPLKPYIKKDGSQSVVTVIGLEIIVTRPDAIGNPCQKKQYLQDKKFGIDANTYASLNLQVGQKVEVEIDYYIKDGFAKYSFGTLQPIYNQTPQPQYTQPQPLNYQQPQQPSVFPNTQAPY